MSPLNIMVIGGTSGIGWALALHYLQAGHRVAVCGRDPGRIDADAARAYPQLKRYALDIADAAAIDHALADFLPAPLPLDLLIVSAGATAILLLGMWFVSNGGFASQNANTGAQAVDAAAFDDSGPPTPTAPTDATGNPPTPPAN